MPEHPNPRPSRPVPHVPPPRIHREVNYVELHCKTNYTFLTGASHPDELVQRAVELGYSEDLAARLFKMMRGFGEYGFPESHAASFALLSYASAWLKCYYPDVFCCALLNSQPMGFYAPSQLVRDAKEHGIEIRPVDINSSVIMA